MAQTVHAATRPLLHFIFLKNKKRTTSDASNALGALYYVPGFLSIFRASLPAILAAARFLAEDRSEGSSPGPLNLNSVLALVLVARKIAILA
jgi:hypothetical protein